MAQRLVAEAHGEERLPALEQPARRPTGASPSWGRRRRAGRPGPGRRSPGRPGPGRRRARRALGQRLVADHLALQALHPQHVAQHLHEVVLAVEDHHPPAAQRRVRRRARLVGEPEPAEPLVAGVEREQHVLVVDQLGDVGRRHRRRRHQAEGAEDAAGLGVGLGHLVRRVAVAHQGGAGGDGQPAVEVDVGGPDHDRRVDHVAALGVAAEQRERGAVVAAALPLVLLDQPAGVLDRRAGHGGGVHRVAQHLARVAGGAAGEEVLGVDQPAHRLEERPEHLPALGADVAHHLELLVDHHEELEDLLLVVQEVEQRGPDVALAGDPEGAADRVHPHVPAVDRDVPLRAGADQVAVAGEEDVGPVRPALALEQPAEHGERTVGTPVGDRGAVVAPDDQVGALALADLVADDRLDELAVRLVVGLEAAPVRQLDLDLVDRLDHLGDRELALGLHVDDHQRRAVVVGLEAALADLAERHGEQPVGDVARLRHPRLQRYVEQRLDDGAPAADQADGVAVAGPGGAPDDRPRLVLPEGRDGFPGGGRRLRHGVQPTDVRRHGPGTRLVGA